MLRMSAAQHEKWEWSMSFLNGSCWGELLHWKHINPFTKTNGEAVKWWRKTSPVKMTCPTQTDSWHFTPQSTIKSLFISGTRLRKKEGGKNCLHDEFLCQAHTHLCMDTHMQIATVSEDDPRLGFPVSPQPPLHPRPPGNRMFTHLNPLQRQKKRAVPHPDSSTSLNECDI